MEKNFNPKEPDEDGMVIGEAMYSLQIQQQINK